MEFTAFIDHLDTFSEVKVSVLDFFEHSEKMKTDIYYTCSASPQVKTWVNEWNCRGVVKLEDVWLNDLIT